MMQPNFWVRWFRYSSLLLVGLVGAWICTLSYFYPVELVTGFLMHPLVHLSLGFLAIGYLLLLVMTTPFLRNHVTQRMISGDPLSRRLRYMEILLFFILIPFLVTIPLASGLNRIFDNGEAKDHSLTVVSASFITKGALETRRCHINAVDKLGEFYLLKARPSGDECQRLKDGDSVEIKLHSGFLATPWISAFRWNRD